MLISNSNLGFCRDFSRPLLLPLLLPPPPAGSSFQPFVSRLTSIVGSTGILQNGFGAGWKMIAQFEGSENVFSASKSHNFCFGAQVDRKPRQTCQVMAAAPSYSEAAGVTESGMFSQSDDDLNSRGFEIHMSRDNINLDKLNSLFVMVGFPRREKGKLLRALEHTVSLLWIHEKKSGSIIGFARATGDSIFNAIIWDVVVDPSYQGLGLGKVMMERLIADLVKRGISNIALYAEPNVVGFYQPLGFISDPDGIRAMAYSRRRR
jgi:ribosomal protein S18 acetylase RimI-like enzyme